MRKLTGDDMVGMAGIVISGYKVVGCRIMLGDKTDSNHYAILWAESQTNKGNYVTWQAHLESNGYGKGERVEAYWGHYFTRDDKELNREMSEYDFHTRDWSNEEKIATSTDYLSSLYWDCECESYFMHPMAVEECERCDALQSEWPQSRLNEMITGNNFAVDRPVSL